VNGHKLKRFFLGLAAFVIFFAGFLYSFAFGYPIPCGVNSQTTYWGTQVSSLSDATSWQHFPDYGCYLNSGACAGYYYKGSYFDYFTPLKPLSSDEIVVGGKTAYYWGSMTMFACYGCPLPWVTYDCFESVDSINIQIRDVG